MKDEAAGKIITEFAALRAKLYSYRMDGEDYRKCKGVKKNVVKKRITHEDFINVCLLIKNRWERWTLSEVAFTIYLPKRLIRYPYLQMTIRESSWKIKYQPWQSDIIEPKIWYSKYEIWRLDEMWLRGDWGVGECAWSPGVMFCFNSIKGKMNGKWMGNGKCFIFFHRSWLMVNFIF